MHWPTTFHTLIGVLVCIKENYFSTDRTCPNVVKICVCKECKIPLLLRTSEGNKSVNDCSDTTNISLSDKELAS